MRASTMTLATLALLAAGCGDDDSPQQACENWVSATCSKIDSCSAMFMAVSYGDVATCAQRLSLVCEPVLAASGVTITASDFNRCASATSDQPCDDLLAGVQPAGCRVEGALEDGKACASDAQCASAYCKKSGECGVCGQRVAAGEACDTDEDCLDNGACREQVCVTYVKAGATCDTTHPCLPPLYCDGGTCATPAAEGASCQVLQQGSCDLLRGLYCDPQAKTCQKIALASAGESCGLVGGVYTACKASGTCDADATLAGTCKAPAADGASCDAIKGPGCLPPASCVDGLCKLEEPTACQ